MEFDADAGPPEPDSLAGNWLPDRPEYEVTLSGTAHGGECVARVEGEVVFVPYGIPGERVRVRLWQKRRDYARGDIVAILEPSPHRVAPPCKYFGTCGGCHWQHVEYGAQLELKREVVVNQLKRVGRFVDPPVLSTLASPLPYHYRNSARFSPDRRGYLCFTRYRSHTQIRIDYCWLLHQAMNAPLPLLQGHGRGLHQIVVRYGFRTGELLIHPQVSGMPDRATGQTAFHEELAGRRFHISAASFFQVNIEMAEQMVALVLERLELTGGETVVDAYSGVGTFALALADRAARVIGIEEAPSARADFDLSRGDTALVEFLKGKTEEILPLLPGPVDRVVLDPPRSGCEPRVIDALLQLRPPRLVYVSCDPATLARDLQLLVAGGFRLEEVQPLDMFPQTYHIECVATLRWGG